MKSRKRRWLERILLVAGLAGLGAWGWSVAREHIYQEVANDIFDGQIQRPRATPPQREKAGSPAPALAAPPRTGSVIARLNIPRLHVNSVVREGADEETLSSSLGHIPGTSLPGQAGNIGVAGHRDTLFRALKGIRKDDLVSLETVSGSYNYRVVSTKIVNPDDVEVLKASLEPEITLVTCYPFYYVGPAPNRFIVKARLVEGDGAPQAPPAAETQAKLVTPPAPPLSRPVTAKVKAKATPPKRVATPPMSRASFTVMQGRRQQILPGVLIGVMGMDARRGRVTGWLWLASERRTIWLRDQKEQSPVYLYGVRDHVRHEVVITRVGRYEVSGYVTSTRL